MRGGRDNLRDANVGDGGAASKENRPDVVDDNGFDSPVGVENGEGAEDGVGDGSGEDEGEDNCGHLIE